MTQTNNLDALAKLAPFTSRSTWGGDEFIGNDGETIETDVAEAALNDWAELRATVAELRRWRSEHDCRYTQGAVADIDGVHCPLDNPCVRCQRRLEWDAAQKENAELRAYKKKAEPVVSRAGDLWASMLADIDDGVEFHPRTRMFLDRLQKEIETEGSDLAQATHDLRSENAELRAYRERTEAALAKLCRQAGNSPTDYEFLTPDDLRDVGLWREPGQGATDG